jgi:hypothetical protein
MLATDYTVIWILLPSAIHNTMLFLIAIVFGALFVASAVTTLIFDNKQRHVLLRRFDVRHRRATGSLKPPRSLSPGKHGLPSNNAPKVPDFSDVFPPSRREALCHLPPDAMHGPGKTAKELSLLPPEYANRVPSEETWDFDKLAEGVTATGFTLDEIKRLGDFPDCSALSGIPLPAEYVGFDITKAKARPFRPLRWAYHQTMCESVGTVNESRY